MGKSARRLMLVAVLSLVTAVVTGGCTEPPTKIAVGVVAYVHPGDPLFTMLYDPSVPLPEYVVLNLANGDGDMTSMDQVAKSLHLRGPVKVLAYVWTSNMRLDPPLPGYENYSNRSEDDIKKSIDNWLVRPDGKVHYDGIFFDVASPVCLHRDKFLSLRDHVKSRLPSALIVHNAGVAVNSCYLEPGKRTADIFGTFEGSERVYYLDAPSEPGLGYWLGGNVSHNGQYVKGDVLTFADGRGGSQQVKVGASSYWHLLYSAKPGSLQQNVECARSRGAGVLTISTAAGPDVGEKENPWRKSDDDPDHLRRLIAAGAGAPVPMPEPCRRVAAPIP